MLSTGVLCVFRTRLVDEAGHVVEDLVQPMFAPLAVPQCRRARDVRAWLERAAPLRASAGVLARTCARERAAATGAALAAGVARLARRERAIADRIARDLGLLARPMQAGLFDRRAERRVEERSRVKAELEEQLRRPAHRAGSTAISPADPELALVLLVTS